MHRRRTSTRRRRSAETTLGRGFLSLFEETRLISLRAEALEHGAPTTLDELPEDATTAVEIARLEFDQGKIPLLLRRSFPSGRTEVMDASELARKAAEGAKKKGKTPPSAESAGANVVTAPSDAVRSAFLGAAGSARIQSTTVAEFSVTKAKDKKALRRVMNKIYGGKGIKGKVVVDGMACIGSDTSLFAAMGSGEVVAVEYDRTNYGALEHNVGALGLADRVRTVRGDVVEELGKIAKADVVYFDPPWGGRGYKNKPCIRLPRIGGAKKLRVRELVERVPPGVRFVVLKLPYNYDVPSLWGAPRKKRGARTFSAELSKADYARALKNPHCAESYCTIEGTTECEKARGGRTCASTCDRPTHRLVYTREVKQADVLASDAAATLGKKRYVPTKVLETVEDVGTVLPPGARYQPRGQRVATVAHLGQLKLFLSTLQFLLEYAPVPAGDWQNDPKLRVHVVYPGSAHGYNIPLLSRLFPWCKWYLVDPGRFAPDLLRDKTGMFEVTAPGKTSVSIMNFRINKGASPGPVSGAAGSKSGKQVMNWVENADETGFFTSELCREYAEMLKGKYTLFISDIRLSTGDTVLDKEVTDDQAMQKEWVDILRPDAAQLKFRPPFGADLYPYLEGKRYLQMYAPHASAETRLVVHPIPKDRGVPLETRDYDVREHENVMYYFNRRIRCADHDRAYEGVVTTPQYTDASHDCMLMLKLVDGYLKRYPDNRFGGGDRATFVKAIFEGVRGIKDRALAAMQRVRDGLADPAHEPVEPFDDDKDYPKPTRRFRMSRDIVDSGNMRFVVFERAAAAGNATAADAAGNATARATRVVNVRKASLVAMGFKGDLRDWMADPNHVYVGRNMRIGVKGGGTFSTGKSKWANPFKVQGGDNAAAVAKYRAYIVDRIAKDPAKYDLGELCGKVLGCWCKPKACHADVLRELCAARSKAGSSGPE